MNRLFSFFLVLAGTALLACGGSEKNQTSSADSLQTADASPSVLKILQPERGGLLRGVKLGDPVEQVVQGETLPLAEDSTTYKGFTQPLTDEGVDEEFADILYRTDGKDKVSSIHVDVFLNEPEAVTTLLNEFNQYFTKRYGASPDGQKWSLPSDQTLTLRDVSVKQAPGLSIEFSRQVPSAKPLIQ